MPSSLDRSSRLFHALLATGTTLAGAYAGIAAARWWHRLSLPPPSSLPPALYWTTRTLETDDGRTHCYVRPGTGPPIVLLHSFDLAASPFEMKPIAEHLAATTDRPLYAIDWLGYGCSDRPALSYTPDQFGRQLYHVLTNLPNQPADLIALSLGCEYAAWMTLQAASKVRRLVLISPSGLTTASGSPSRRLANSLAGKSGIFELYYYHRTRPTSLQNYYRQHAFLSRNDVPTELIEYAATTAHCKGAHHAPRSYAEGRLSLTNVVSEIYGHLYRPTLLLTPSTPGPLSQSYDLLPVLLDRNQRYLSHHSLPGGMMPHWAAPSAFFEALDNFLLTQ